MSSCAGGVRKAHVEETLFQTGGAVELVQQPGGGIHKADGK